MDNFDDPIIYQILVDKDNLGIILDKLSEAGKIDYVVGPDGDVNFNITEDSNINIKCINILERLRSLFYEITEQKAKTKTKTSKDKYNAMIKTVNIIFDLFMDAQK
jgi:hypothetical protein